MHVNKVVARTRDGRVVKGITHDFDVGRDSLHILPAEGGGIPVRIRVAELKAVFFVKDWIGNRDYDPPEGFATPSGKGRRCIVTFSDGEVVFGFTPDHREGARGFTLFPADPADNNERLFVIADAVRSVQFPDALLG